MDNRMLGKSILLTGGTNGIGLAAAHELARLGGNVTIVGRSEEKCTLVSEKIQAQTGQPVEAIVADLSTLAGIRHAASIYRKNHDMLHVLINNAGGLFAKQIITPDGFNYTFSLNYLNYFLLTNLLIDLLKASAPSRIINTSSYAHKNAKIDFDNLQGEKSIFGLKAYGQSKLMEILFTYELARRLEGTEVTVNALHPGVVATGFARNNGLIYNVGTWLAGQLFFKNPNQGAKTIIHLASSPEVEGVTGKYFVDCRAVESSPRSYDCVTAEKLWSVTETLLSLPPES